MPSEVDDQVARLALAAMGAEIDELTEEQVNYMNSWDQDLGTRSPRVGIGIGIGIDPAGQL